MAGFATSRLPEMIFGPGALSRLGDSAADITSGRRALIIVDPFLAQSGVLDRVQKLLVSSGFVCAAVICAGGEPKERQIVEAIGPAVLELIERVE